MRCLDSSFIKDVQVILQKKEIDSPLNKEDKVKKEKDDFKK